MIYRVEQLGKAFLTIVGTFDTQDEAIQCARNLASENPNTAYNIVSIDGYIHTDIAYALNVWLVWSAK